MKRFSVRGNYTQYEKFYWSCELDEKFSENTLTEIYKLEVGEIYTIKDKGFETVIERLEDD